MNIFIKFLLLNLLLITSSFSQDQNYDEELNCDQFTELSFEVDQDQAPLTFYAYAPGIDNPIAMVRDHNGNGRFEDNEVFYFTKDHLGSIRELTDKDGNVVQRYRYSAYGETTIEKANPQTQHKIVENRYAFTGREIENEFGCLYFYRNRTLNVCTKQFIEPDPIGFESGDFNNSRYVKNRAINENDPTGNGPVAVALCRKTVTMETSDHLQRINSQKNETLSEIQKQITSISSQKGCETTKKNVIKELEQLKVSVNRRHAGAYTATVVAGTLSSVACGALIAVPGL